MNATTEQHSRAPRHFAALVLMAPLCLATSSCVDAAPCTMCPAVEGVYAMTYQTASNTSPGCSKLAAPQAPQTLQLLRNGSALQATIAGMPVQGTVFDTWDFSLNGTQAIASGGSTSVALTGKWLAPATTSDGGAGGGADAAIRGTLTLSASSGADQCSATQSFTGGRI